MIRDFYEDKTILLTGTTGFIGKVLLEMILRKLSNVRKIYMLVRPKTGFTLMERVNNEVLGSKCFEKWKKDNPEYKAIIEKIVPVSGDLVKEGLGLSLEDRQMITDECQIIFNIAASVDFNSRLDQAIEINIDGSLRMQQLAKDCKHIECFTHMSTCYVNSDKKGFIEEKIYDINMDVEDHIKYLKSLSVSDIEKLTPDIIGGFPNTYTYTKSMGERLLQKHRGSLPTFIIRPSIVGCSYREPYQGWVDNISAAGAMVFFVGLGVIRDGIGDYAKTGDVIPVDYVCNATLIGTAMHANKNELAVHHSASSSINQITWGLFIFACGKYFTSIPFEQQFKAPRVHFLTSKRKYEFWAFLNNTLPQKIYSGIAKATFSTTMKKNADRLKKINQKGQMVNYLMAHFTTNEWIFDAPLYHEYNQAMSEADKEAFPLDINIINWKHYTYLYCYGLQTFVMKQKGVPIPNENFDDILAKDPRQSYFDDIVWTFNRGKIRTARKQSEVLQIITSSPAVVKAMREYAESSSVIKKYDGYSDREIMGLAEAKVMEYANEMCAKMKKHVLKAFAWASHKALRRMFDKLIVDVTDLKMLKKLQETSENPIVLIPSRKSYMDLPLLGYIFFAYGLKQPFFSVPIQYRDIRLLNRIFNASGAFYVQEKNDRPLYNAVLNEYISTLLNDSQTMSICLEESREKNGIMVRPNLKLFNSVLQGFFNGKSNDVDIIPVTINYDRILEGETFPYELTGEETVKESLSRFISSARYINTPFGKCCIKFGEKISVKDYVQSLGIAEHKIYTLSQDIRQDVTSSLSKVVMESLMKNTVIMSTGPVASILLQYRKGISNENLVSQVEWIYDELEARKAQVSETSMLTRGTVNTMILLDEFVKKNKDVFEPFVSPRIDYKNILMLAYYKNTMTHVFLKEMIIAVSLLGFGRDTIKEQGVNRDRLWIRTQYLSQMLSKMFVYDTGKLSTKEEFESVLDFMIQREIIYEDEGLIKYQVITGKTKGLVFLCSMIWPFIDSYWLTLVFIYTLFPDTKISQSKIMSKIQWFAESLYEDNIVLHYESCSLDTIAHAVDHYLDQGIIVKETKDVEGEGSKIMIGLHQKYQADDSLIQQEFDKVTFYKKLSLIKFSNLKTDINKTILSDFPIMSNL